MKIKTGDQGRDGSLGNRNKVGSCEDQSKAKALEVGGRGKIQELVGRQQRQELQAVCLCDLGKEILKRILRCLSQPAVWTVRPFSKMWTTEGRRILVGR